MSKIFIGYYMVIWGVIRKSIVRNLIIGYLLKVLKLFENIKVCMENFGCE